MSISSTKHPGYKKMKDKNIPIYICNPSSHAEKIFKMTGLYEIMPKII